MNDCPEWLLTRPISHRGLFSNVVPENSFEAFGLAIENNLPIEFDVQLTWDNAPIVFHDRNLRRMTGRNINVTRHNINEIKLYQLKDNREEIPTLEEFLRLVDGKVPLCIEIKTGWFRHTDRAFHVAETLKNYSGEFVVKSFDEKIVKWFGANTDYYTGLILDTYRDETLSEPFRFNKNSLKNCKPDFISHDLSRLSPKISSRVREELPLIVWTVRNEIDKKKAVKLADNYIFESFDNITI